MREAPPEEVAGHSGSIDTRPDEGVRHHAFFVAASQVSDQSAQYAELTAGLMVLRLLDKWRDRRSDGRQLRAKELNAVRRLVRNLDEGPVHSVLDEVLSAMSNVSGDRITGVRMYALLLEREGQWGPAADAYRAAIELIGVERRQREQLPLCYQRAGYCHRELGEIDKAAEAFRRGKAIATNRKDVEWQLRLRISETHLELDRGNIPAAESQCDDIVAAAEQANLPTVVARAKHDRGHVAYTRQQYEQAAQLFFEAIELYEEPALKLRAMHDLATVLGDLSLVTYSQRVLRVVRRSALQTSIVRIMAGLNLMRLAVLGQSENEFAVLRAELAAENMPARLRARFHVIAGEGLREFGDPAGSQAQFHEAVSLARTHHLNQLLVETEEMLKQVPKPRPVVQPSDRPGPALAIILGAIDQQQGAFAEATP
jgi:tetratricopeptide (TPR) repeat protein